MDSDLRSRAMRLEALGERASVAFAAACAERGFTEISGLTPHSLTAHPALRAGIDLLWHHAATGEVDFESEGAPIIRAITPLIPASAEEPRRDPTLEYTARALSLGIAAIMQVADAGRLAAFAGDAICSLIGTVYEPWDIMRAAEERWQEAAVSRLEGAGGMTLSRETFDGIPDYERGPVSDEYRDIIESP